MCGILFEILYHGRSVLEDETVLKRIKNRGPDCIHVVDVDIRDGVKVRFCGAVLWMQGVLMTAQPLDDENGILLYNGDIFDESWDRTSSDTQQIMQRLGGAPNDHQIVQELKNLKGPFSIIYYKKATSKLFFTRDRIGRNTLLFHKSTHSLVISSVLGRTYKCVEIPAAHICVLNLETNYITQHSWTNDTLLPDSTSVDDWYLKLEKQQSIPDEAFSIEFAGVNVMGDNSEVISDIENIAKTTKCKLTLMTQLLEYDLIKETVFAVTELLNKSVRIRLETQPQKCKECLRSQFCCDHCSVGVLFSGGLDCTILALLADKYIAKEQSIDLLNVAFNKKETGNYEVPDRITGRQSFEELKKLRSSRKWEFKEINVPREELESCQKQLIADLVYPRQTILDESLGSALWFAARGQDESSTSSCRVLLVGSGADELFGGYTRHSNAYRRCGWAGLHKELQLDWNRISFRNLARDNRVIADHGRQPRMPYLDEDLADYVLKLPPWLKCFPSDDLGKEIGMKILLRLVAFQLGLREVVTFPKRALQFGSRIANSKEKGSDLSKTFIEEPINQ